MLPESLESIGDSAFQGCELSSLPVTLPESVAFLGNDAFSNCTGLEELRILRQDCVIGKSLAPTSLTTLCGFPGSTTEQYANQNGYAFVPVTLTDLDAVAEQVARDQAERGGLDGAWKDAFGGVTTIEGIGLLGDRYLAKLVRSVSITASEEEIAKAKTDRLIILQGEPFSYRDTQAQYDSSFGSYYPHTIKEDGFIYLQQGLGNAPYYDVCRVGDSYVFACDLGSSWSRLEEVTDTAWILLDKNTLWTYENEEPFLFTAEFWPFVKNTIYEIQYGRDGAVQICCAKKQKR